MGVVFMPLTTGAYGCMLSIFMGIAFNAVPLKMDTDGCFLSEAHFDHSVPISMLEAFIAKWNNSHYGAEDYSRYESRSTLTLYATHCVASIHIMRMRMCVTEKSQ